jgi:hypothetical protein
LLLQWTAQKLRTAPEQPVRHLHMNDQLSSKIKQAYPMGMIYDLDESALISYERDGRILTALTKAATECSLSIWVEPFDKPAYSITLTQKEHPPLEVWIWQMQNSDKIAWIKANKQPYPAFWLKISRVADFYYCFYNHWVPRGDTGYLDADCDQKPNSLWLGYEKIIRRELEANSFVHLSDELAKEKTPFVLEHNYDSIPDNDQRWDEDRFEPPLVASSVHKCLFKH